MKAQHRLDVAPVTSEVMEITPALAKYWLSKVTPGSQRPLAESHIVALTAEMLADRWMMNGESIVISFDDVPLDGQHRLSAVVRSGVTILSLVVRNVPADTFPTFDSGRKRGVFDVLSIAGYHTTHLMSGVLRWIYAEEQNALGWVKIPSLPHSEAIRLAKTHDLSLSMRKGSSGGKSARLLPPTLAVFLHYRFSEIDPEAADNFFKDLETGANLHRTRPVFHLRNRLLENRAEKKTKLLARELCALTIKAFKAEQAGERIQFLRWRQGGAQAEAFPTIED